MANEQQPVSGYVVGQTPDGNIVFEILGDPKPGLFALLGAHAYATYEISKIEDAFHKYGPVQVGGILNQLIKNLDISFQALKRDVKSEVAAILDKINPQEPTPNEPEDQ